MSALAVRERVPLLAGMLAGPLERLEGLRLAGTRCETCGETALGTKRICPNCGRETVRPVTLAERGTLWSYTVVRHRPPGNYRGPEPFAPFGLGLVELPEGVRVLSPIRCDIDALKVGLPLRFVPYVRADAERDVVVFEFAAIDEAAAHG